VQRPVSRVVPAVEEVPPLARRCKFVDGEFFQQVVCVLLLANTWALIRETDTVMWPYWHLVNALFLVCYILEFALRALHGGVLLFRGQMRYWAAYDLLTLVLGVMDFAASCLAASPGLQLGLDGGVDIVAVAYDYVDPAGKRQPHPTGQQSVGLALRCLMLTRLLRVVRIVRMHKPLYNCMQLLMGMVHTFAWILSIVFTLIFVLAIALTALVGCGVLARAGEQEESEENHILFEDIPAALFTLFQLTTADDWSRISTPMVAVNPTSSRLFFVSYITFMSWTLLSLLTAVASEQLISASSTKKVQEAEEKEIRRHSFTHFLCAEFMRADTDGNKKLDRDEFTALMNQESMKQQMKAHGILLQENDIKRAWESFDIDESGELTIDELVAGFSYMQENLAMKHVANVCYSLKHFGAQMDSGVGSLEQGMETLQKQLESVCSAVLLDCKLERDRWAQFVGVESGGVTPEPEPEKALRIVPAPTSTNNETGECLSGGSNKSSEGRMRRMIPTRGKISRLLSRSSSSLRSK